MGAGTTTIVGVGIAAIVVRVDVAETSVAGVVVVAAAPRKALRSAKEWPTNPARSLFITFSIIHRVHPATD